MAKRTKDTTIRDFGGGLNIADSDLNLSSKFSKVLDNMYRKLDGSLALRYGTTFFADISAGAAPVTGNAIIIKYFISHIIVVTSTGQIAKVSSTGVVTAI